MKVFLSWSGSNSHRVALTLRDWLPSVIQSIEPYVSSEDIDKGARWSTDIAKELSNSTFGILCVTKENINAPWLTFEAGALSKTMEKSFVCPFLFDIKRSEVEGPLLQFQSVIFQKGDLLKLVKTLNKACDKDKLTEDRLEKAFSVWYPTLEQELNKIKVEVPKPDGTTSKDGGKRNEPISKQDHDILEEMLELIRLQHKLLRNPESILPPDYLLSIIDRRRHLEGNMFQQPSWQELFGRINELRIFISEISNQKSVAPNKVIDTLKPIIDIAEYVEKRFIERRRPPEVLFRS